MHPAYRKERYKERRGDTKIGNEEGDRIWNKTQDVGYELELESSMAGTRVSSRTMCIDNVNKDKSDSYYDVYSPLQI